MSVSIDLEENPLPESFIYSDLHGVQFKIKGIREESDKFTCRGDHPRKLRYSKAFYGNLITSSNTRVGSTFCFDCVIYWLGAKRFREIKIELKSHD